MAHTRFMLDKQGYMHTRPRVRAPTRTHAHTDKYVICIAFPRQQWFTIDAVRALFTFPRQQWFTNDAVRALFTFPRQQWFTNDAVRALFKLALIGVSNCSECEFLWSHCRCWRLAETVEARHTLDVAVLIWLTRTSISCLLNGCPAPCTVCQRCR